MKGLLERCRDVRRRTFGPRGRTQCAWMLGIAPSTLADYETRRVAPLAVLARLAQVAGGDLRWLLTGQFPAAGPEEGTSPAPEAIAILERFDRKVRRRSGALPATVALLDILEEAIELEAEPNRQGATTNLSLQASQDRLIPVLGRTAAAVPVFWQRGGRTTSVTLAVPPAKPARSRRALLQTVEQAEHAPYAVDARVHWVRYSRPISIAGLSVAEFLDCTGLRADLRDAFALRIDGDSMVPILTRGDAVIVSPRCPARPGHVAVVQLRNQIGVMCKLYRQGPRRVSLIPLNERYRPTAHPIEEVIWALDVLYRVRAGTAN